jgi:glutamate/tyrosine decarboxylase-like PLP-dependent enzyme
MSSSEQPTTAELIERGHHSLASWESQWPEFEQDETLQLDPGRAEAIIDALTARLADNYPFFHPHYAGQMLKPPHPIAAAAYAITQRINPNAHALDGGPATAALEREVIDELAAMFGYDPAKALGHLTSSGTIANLEALWVAHSLHPGRAIAFSEGAHYTHSRMCEVIGAEGIAIATDISGRIDLDALEAALATGRIGTVVATAGTTSLGSVDPIDQILPLVQHHGARIHVDAAYGGFFTLLAGNSHETATGSSTEGHVFPETAAAFRAIAACDSVVVDPHKHGLQPYGCGSVLFRDAAVGRFYRHDSPYTYFTSDELHLGEISLECSRAGAAAAALWATLQAFPLRADTGLGPILRKTRTAAQRWASRIDGSDQLRLLIEPELDIVAFYPLPGDDRRTSTISSLTRSCFTDLMHAAVDPLYLATLNVKPPLGAPNDDLVWDNDMITIFRSVLMKPEHADLVPWLHNRLLEGVGQPTSP